MTSGCPDAYWEATLSTLPSSPPDPNPFVAGACTPVPSQGGEGGRKGTLLFFYRAEIVKNGIATIKWLTTGNYCVCAPVLGVVFHVLDVISELHRYTGAHTHTPDKYPNPSGACKSSFSVFLCRFSAFFAPPPHTISSTAQDTQLVHHLTYSRNVLGTYLLMDT